MQIHNFEEIRIAYQPKLAKRELPKITSSSEAADILRPLYNEETIEYTEQFIVLFMNRANKPIGWKCIAQGGLDTVAIDIRTIFQGALLMNGHAIIVSHNHPSGNLKPSHADVRLTERLKNAGKILEIPLLDHIIITTDGYYSFADNGEI